MVIHTLPLGAYQTNTYLIHREENPQCLVIDPGYDAPAILEKLSQEGLSLQAILLTHGHFDHVGAVKDLVAETDCQVYLNPADTRMPPQLTAGSLYYTHSYPQSNTLLLADLPIEILHTPGHTPGSVCLKIENHLFSGDTLFAGSCGRTDLPGGSSCEIKESLARLAALEEALFVYPGHGCATTLQQEKRTNPYLR